VPTSTTVLILVGMQVKTIYLSWASKQVQLFREMMQKISFLPSFGEKVKRVLCCWAFIFNLKNEKYSQHGKLVAN
jgi:hypothetical protein